MANRICAGILTNSVYIEQPTTDRNEYGEPVNTWTLYQTTTVRAGIRDLGGNEVIAAGQQQAIATHEVTIRPVSGLTRAMRFRDANDGTIYAIVDITIPNRERGVFEYRCRCRVVE